MQVARRRDPDLRYQLRKGTDDGTTAAGEPCRTLPFERSDQHTRALTVFLDSQGPGNETRPLRCRSPQPCMIGCNADMIRAICSGVVMLPSKRPKCTCCTPEMMYCQR